MNLSINLCTSNFASLLHKCWTHTGGVDPVWENPVLLTFPTGHGSLGDNVGTGTEWEPLKWQDPCQVGRAWDLEEVLALFINDAPPPPQAMGLQLWSRDCENSPQLIVRHQKVNSQTTPTPSGWRFIF